MLRYFDLDEAFLFMVYGLFFFGGGGMGGIYMYTGKIAACEFHVKFM